MLTLLTSNVVTFDDIFKSDFLQKTATFSLIDAVIGLVSAFILGMFIYFVYKKTFNGVIYSHSFNIALMVMTLATALVIMGISQNILLSLGMVGALSIVRFRTPIKDAMDLMFLFWSVVVGILCGAGFIPLAAIGSIVIGLVIVLFQHKIIVENPYLVVVKFEHEETNDEIEQLLKVNTKKYLMKSSSVISEYEMEVTYEIRIKENDAKLISNLYQIPGVQSAIMLSYDGNFTA